MQFWADCHSADASHRPLAYPVLIPTDIEIMHTVPRLALGGAHDKRGIAISTSDELGLFLLSLKSD